jgi:hypothetical protein
MLTQCQGVIVENFANPIFEMGLSLLAFGSDNSPNSIGQIFPELIEMLDIYWYTATLVSDQIPPEYTNAEPT